MRTIYFILLLFVASVASSQPFALGNQKTIGTSKDDYLDGILHLSDGGLLAYGLTDGGVSGDKTLPGYGSSDVWLLKYDSLFNLQWQTVYGTQVYDRILSAIENNKNEIVLVMSTSAATPTGNKTSPSYGGNDVWIATIGLDGTEVNQYTIGGSGDDVARNIIQLQDSTYLISCSSNSNIGYDKSENAFDTLSDGWIIKVDADFNRIWDRTIGGTLIDYFDNVVFDAYSNSIYLVGRSSSNLSGNLSNGTHGFQDVLVSRLTLNGDILKNKLIGSEDSENLGSNVLLFNNKILVGCTAYTGVSGDKTDVGKGASDVWLFEIDTSLNVLWDKCYGGDMGEIFYDMKSTASQGIIISTSSNSSISGDKNMPSYGLFDNWTFTLDDNYMINSQIALGGTSNDDVGSIAIGEKVYIGMYSQSNISGNKTENSRGSYDYWIVELNNLASMDEIDEQNKISLYPNPATEVLNINLPMGGKIQVQVNDMLGRTLYNAMHTAESTLSLPVSNWKPGMYTIRIQTPGQPVWYHKVVKQ